MLSVKYNAFLLLQLFIDLEVLEEISRTRAEIRALRDKYAAMTSSNEMMTSILLHHQSHHHHLHKPQLQVKVVRSRRGK